ncbi:MAG: hypothetical protein ACLRNQ_19460 [Flavonifractor plautii]
MDIMNGLLGFGDKLYQAFLVEDRWRLYLDGLGSPWASLWAPSASARCWAWCSA